MKPDDSKIDPMLLQRLIDGELDNEQVQQILIEASSTPGQWREIAVGFVENQTWTNAFQSDFQRIENSQRSSYASTFVDHANETTNANDEKVSKSKNSETASSKTRSPNPWWVMAASLLVAGAIGFMASEILNRDMPTNPIAGNQNSSLSDSNDLAIAEKSRTKTDKLPRMTPATLTPDYHLEVPNDNEHFRDFALEKSNSQVPIYRVTNQQEMDQLYAKRQLESVPSEVLLQFSGAGYQMQTEIEFISGKIGDDESFVVPVRTIFFVPGQ